MRVAKDIALLAAGAVCIFVLGGVVAFLLLLALPLDDDLPPTKTTRDCRELNQKLPPNPNMTRIASMAGTVPADTGERT